VSGSLRVLGLLGQGGFGKVYLARREGADGWTRDVAVKLLDPARADDAALRRFRDEARILALVRDRAVVSAEPPVALTQGWAVIMEYVAGRTLADLLAEDRRPPPTAALELVEEVARALGHLGEATGPDGAPLGLVHRDLKPANLQLTRAGEVKILDFGIAHVRMATREASTTAAIIGTPGFIAPERLLGQDGPAADVYALGVVLSRMLGDAPAEAAVTGDDAPAQAAPSPTGPLSDLVRAMTAYAPSDRPTARDVERRARSLRSALAGEGLREWCEREVPATPPLARDALTGTDLLAPAAAPRRPPWVAAAAALLAFGALATRGLPGAPSPAADPVADPNPVDDVAAPAAEGAAPAADEARSAGAVDPAPPPPRAAPASPPTDAPPPVSTNPARAPTPAALASSTLVPPPEPPARAVVSSPEPTAHAIPEAPPSPEPAAPPPREPQRPTEVPVGLRGDAERVRATADGRSVPLPGRLTPGVWRLEVTFPGGAPFLLPRPITVGEAALTVDCRLRLNGCAVAP
jgi:hypothetical protein